MIPQTAFSRWKDDYQDNWLHKYYIRLLPQCFASFSEKYTETQNIFSRVKKQKYYKSISMFFLMSPVTEKDSFGLSHLIYLFIYF